MRSQDPSTGSARASLGICFALAAILVLVPAGGRLVIPAASAGTETPVDPNDLLPGPSPSPSPSPTPSPSKQPNEDDGKDERPSTPKAASGSKQESRVDKKTTGEEWESRKKAKRRRARRKENRFVYPSISYSSSRLVSAAMHLRALGVSRDTIRRTYGPFAVAGESSWADTWGAPRFGPGKRVRKHEGQDLFCHEGAPVLAIEAGRIEFDTTTLGGLVARLHTTDGRYFYYAHLSGWNTAEFSSGDAVASGDEIGYCGNSGNAEGTSPHVHFGWYDGSGTDAQNPHTKLVENLLAAERAAAERVSRMQRRVSRSAPTFRVRRLFGDKTIPELSVLQGCSPAQARKMLTSVIILGPLAIRGQGWGEWVDA